MNTEEAISIYESVNELRLDDLVSLCNIAPKAKIGWKMVERFINVGIFWLPLIAGIILGGMSPSVWYGGDKISALWMTFFGIVLLLLTAAFQVQSYIQSTILQPQLKLIKPEHQSILTWNPPADNSLNIKGENDELPPGGWRVPTFAIKNLTPINAQDVKITWSATKYDSASLVSSKPAFKGIQVSTSNNAVTIQAPNSAPFMNPLAFSTSLEKPFITRSSETFIPLDVWNTAALFFLSTLQDQTGAKSEPYYFDLEVSWNIPENSKPTRYRVSAVATRLSSAGGGPAFKAAIDFTVEQN